MVLQQVGREAVLDEAVRTALPELVRGRRAGRGHRHGRRAPTSNMADLPEKGAPLAFTFEVGVRPKAQAR